VVERFAGDMRRHLPAGIEFEDRVESLSSHGEGSFVSGQSPVHDRRSIMSQPPLMAAVRRPVASWGLYSTRHLPNTSVMVSFGTASLPMSSVYPVTTTSLKTNVKNTLRFPPVDF